MKLTKSFYSITKYEMLRSPALFRSHTSLFITFGVDDFNTAHGANTLLVCTRLAVMGSYLMHFLFAYTTLLELHGHGVEPVLAVGQELVLAHLPTPGFSCVASSGFPGVWSDHLPQLAFLLAFVTNHGDSFLFLSCRSESSNYKLGRIAH